MVEQHVIIEDEALRAGFTQIPNQILRRTDLQPGAKLTFMVLLSYAWQRGDCYPGQDRLAEDMGVSERSVITYLKQLVDAGLITIIRRGLGLTNTYVIHRMSRSENSALLAGSENSALPEMKNPAPLEVQNLQLKKTQLNKTQIENHSKDSKGLDAVGREEREEITWVMADISAEFADQSPAASSATRACRLYVESGLDLDDFLDVVQQARLRTKRHVGRIKATRLPNGAKPKMAYFFGVLENLAAPASNRQ